MIMMNLCERFLSLPASHMFGGFFFWSALSFPFTSERISWAFDAEAVWPKVAFLTDFWLSTCE